MDTDLAPWEPTAREEGLLDRLYWERDEDDEPDDD